MEQPSPGGKAAPNAAGKRPDIGCVTKTFLVQTHRKCLAERGRPRPLRRAGVAAVSLAEEDVLRRPFVAKLGVGWRLGMESHCCARGRARTGSAAVLGRSNLRA